MRIAPAPDSAVLVDELRPSRRPGLLPHPHPQQSGSETWACAWAPDGTVFAWSCGDCLVKLIPWNRYKHRSYFHRKDQLTLEEDRSDCAGEELEIKPLSIHCGAQVWSLAFGSSDADLKPNSINLNWWRYKKASDVTLATGLANGRIRTWDVRTGELILELLDHRALVRDLKFAPDGSLRLASASHDGTIKLWDLQDDGNMYRTLRTPCKYSNSVTWAPNVKMLATSSNNRSVVLWDMSTYKVLRKLEGHSHSVSSCDFSPDGAVLATASYDTLVILWDPHTGQQLMQFGHLYPPPSLIYAGGANGAYVRSISYSHDGRHIATVCDDDNMRFWDTHGSSSAVQVAAVSNALCCSYSPDGVVLAVGHRSGNVQFFLSPMKVNSLQHLCRMAIRRTMPSTTVDPLLLPTSLKEFLKYRF